LLEDYRKITVERKGETNFFTSQDIKNCMKKGASIFERSLAMMMPENHHDDDGGACVCVQVVGVNIHQTIRVDNELEIKAFYAGHVCLLPSLHGSRNEC